MIQETSKVSYLELVNSDKLGEMQKKVLDGIVALKEATDREVADFLNLEINIVTARRNELFQDKIVEDVTKRPCKITGRLALVWRLKENNSNFDSKAEKRGCLSHVLFIRLMKDLERCNEFQKSKILEKLQNGN